MPYWLRTNDGRVRIFKSVNNKITSYPRAMSRHLDSQEDAVIDRYVASLEPKAPVIPISCPVDSVWC